MAKIQPAQNVLTYTVTPSSGSIDFTLDLAKDLSAVNRRLYRQGMQYHVSGVRLTRADTGISALTVSTAGDTWMVHNAWKKGYNLWRNQVKSVTSPPDGGPGDHGRHHHGAGMSGIEGKWADFKIELADDSPSVINTIAGDGGTIVPDEWNLSNFVWDDDGTERYPTFCLLGASAVNSKIGLVQEYHISRAQQADEPTVSADASDSIYAKALGTDEFTDQLVDIVETENDAPPYDANEMVGGDTVADAPFIQDFMVASFAGGTASSVPFTAECGLIKCSLQSVQADGSTASDVPHVITVHLTSGNYKGVLAAPMGQ